MLEIIGLVLIFGALGILVINKRLAKLNNNFPKVKREDFKKVGILIPARDESLVIEDLLISIKKQSFNVNMQDVYVIVEDKNDLSIKIAKKYGAKVIVRKHLELKSKGYALDEAIKYLIDKNIYYDVYFIMDADNVLDKNFIKEMNKSYVQGYDIAIGYRNLKNGNDSLVAATSGITFTIINSNGNDLKSMESRNVTLSGTGLFIVGDLIRKWKSFPFHSLTEDYELTLYTIENNLHSVYNKKAIFYDEQPIKYKNTINQRMRWIRGYFSNRKKYIPKFRKLINKNNPNIGTILNEISGMRPFIILIIGVLLYLLSQIINIFKGILVISSCLKILVIIISSYLAFMLFTWFVINKDKDIINLSDNQKFKVILFSPLFFLTYIPCAIKALLKKEVAWDKVKHTRRWNDNN